MSIKRHLATTLYVLPLLALLSGGNALADEGGDSHLETSCAPVKTFAVKVELANMDRISDMDKDNINALRASVTTLQGLDKVYILGRNHEFGKRTFVIPHEECAAGCIGYIVSNASHGVGVTTFWYRYNVMIKPAYPTTPSKGPTGSIVFLSPDQRNIVSVFNTGGKDSPGSTLIAPPEKTGRVSI